MQPQHPSALISIKSSAPRPHKMALHKPAKKRPAPTGTRTPACIGLPVAGALCGLAALLLANAAAQADFPTTLQQQQQQQQQQLLQVFSGPSNDTHWNHFKLLERQGDFLLLGARNVVYNLSVSSLREQRRLEWPPAEDDVKMCRVKGKSADQCHNYIRVLKLRGPNSLLVCGTNAYKPRCRTYLITAHSYELESELPGEGFCPYQENQNVTSLFTDGQLYSATATQFSGIDGLIHRAPLRTEQFNTKQLNSPNFVASFRHGAYVYFLFRETAIEHLNCGKTVYSRIARVCINDQGGPSRASRSTFTSFTKARLNCSIPGEFPFYFDEIQASTGVLAASPLGELLYAVFTTPPNSIGGSAVCAFRMSDILAAFEGQFKGQADSQSNWLPVPESRTPSDPRPGTCVNDSRQLADETVSFIKENPLMEQAVEAIYAQPLIMMASINFRFTQIAVDPQVESRGAPQATSMRTDVVFVATNDGRVFKLINTHHLASSTHLSPTAVSSPEALMSVAQQQQQPVTPDVSASALVIEELHLFDAHTPINGLSIVQEPVGPPKLLVLSAHQLKAVHLARCERALTCQDCLALLDPYCVWDTRHMACLTAGRATAAAGSARFAAGNNHTLAWWHQCAPSFDSASAPPQVGQPFRSLFSSHLQVPSRYDYASGHHLSAPSSALSALVPQRPASAECLTFCGSGAPTPQVAAAAAAAAGCADLVHRHYIGAGGSGSATASSVAAAAAANLYTSENLYFAVIVCALLALILGLLFGFAMGRQGKRHDASVCSSTFDETNLYMAASTNSHNHNNQHHLQQHGTTSSHLANLFAAQRLLQHGTSQHHPPTPSTHQHQQLRLANGQLFDAASQCLLYDNANPNSNHHHHNSASSNNSSSYGNQQQMLLQLPNQHPLPLQLPLPAAAAAVASQRMGALPPLPQQQHQFQQQQLQLQLQQGPSSTGNSSSLDSCSSQAAGPLINTTSTQISRSQLTPATGTPANNISAAGSHHPASSVGSSSSGANTNTNSTATINDHQLYLNQHQLHQLQHHQHPSPPLSNASGNNNNNNNNHHHKSASVNGSLIKGGPNNNNNSTTKNHSSSFQQQQQQLQLHQQQLQNNKIYL